MLAVPAAADVKYNGVFAVNKKVRYVKALVIHPVGERVKYRIAQNRKVARVIVAPRGRKKSVTYAFAVDKNFGKPEGGNRKINSVFIVGMGIIKAFFDNCRFKLLIKREPHTAVKNKAFFNLNISRAVFFIRYAALFKAVFFKKRQKHCGGFGKKRFAAELFNLTKSSRKYFRAVLKAPVFFFYKNI